MSIQLTEGERLLICVALDRFAQENERLAELGGSAAGGLGVSARAARALIRKLQETGIGAAPSFLARVRERSSDPK